MLAARPLYASAFGRPVFIGVALGAGLAGAGAIFSRVAGVALPHFSSALCGLLLLLLALVLLGNFDPRSGIFGRPLLRGPADRPRVALTFDDGPDAVSTRAVLAVLRRHGVRATFFVIGERAAQNPTLIAELAADGHQIENHSLRHAFSTPFMSRGRLFFELQETQRIITTAQKNAGLAVRPPRWFRPPIGILSPSVAAAAQHAGLRLCGWSCKARDGLRSTSSATALARLRAGLTPGAILLLHDAVERGGRDPVAPVVLEALLPILKMHGLSAVTLDELLGEAGA